MEKYHLNMYFYDKFKTFISMVLHKKLTQAILFTLIFSLSSCAGSNFAASNKKKPDWVKSRPASDEYYIGIGMANTFENNYIKVAKNNALTDMISEISVNISSNSVLRQFEDKSGFSEEFESITKTQIKDELEGYKMVDSWEGDGTYWVYYRLSKEKYQRMKREKLERAKELAKDFYEKAREAEQNLDIHNALNYYVKAFEAIKTHLDEDLSVFTLDGRIYLGNDIYQNIQEIFSSIEFEPTQDAFQIRTLSADNEPVKAKVYYQKGGSKRSVADIPVIFSFPEEDIDETEKVNSNASGTIICSIAEMAPKGKQQKIKATLNTEIYFGEKEKGNLLREMFRLKGSVPYGYLTVHVADLKAYFEAEESEFGKPIAGNPVTKLFKKELSEDFFSFVPDKKEADVIVKVSANTTKGKKMEKFDLYTAYLNCNISVTNARTNAEIYSTGLHNIKGMKTGGFHMAAQDARSKAEKQIQEQIIPDLRRMNF